MYMNQLTIIGFTDCSTTKTPTFITRQMASRRKHRGRTTKANGRVALIGIASLCSASSPNTAHARKRIPRHDSGLPTLPIRKRQAPSIGTPRRHHCKA